MTFQITPRDYLGMLQAQDSDFQDDPLSLGKAIALSMFANHISEHVFAAYCGSDTSKIVSEDGSRLPNAHREHEA